MQCCGILKCAAFSSPRPPKSIAMLVFLSIQDVTYTGLYRFHTGFRGLGFTAMPHYTLKRGYGARMHCCEGVVFQRFSHKLAMIRTGYLGF